MGRAVSNNPRLASVGAKMTAEELDQVYQKMKQRGFTKVSEYVREAVLRPSFGERLRGILLGGM